MSISMFLPAMIAVLGWSLLIFETEQVFAKEFRYFYRSPKALLMGDAFTAVADDEYTLFYNPAALGRHQGLSVYFVNPDVTATNVLKEMDRFENFPEKDAVAIADRVLGLPLHLHLAGTPGLKLASFGMNMFANLSTNIVLKNAIHPALDVDYRLDRGFIFGYAYTLGSGFKPKRESKRKAKSSKGSKAGNKTSIGVGIKNLNRQGIYDSYDLFGLELLNIISGNNAGDMLSIRRELGYSRGSGWGLDAGAEYSWTSSISQLNIGFSVLDIGNTSFKRDDGLKDVPPQEMTMNLGTAWRQDFFIIDYTLSLDYQPLNVSMDYIRKIHVGFELGLPLVSALVGWNGGYVSYGLQFEFWPIKILAGFYGIELGGVSGQEEAKRGVVYVSILNFSFDA